MSARLLSLIVAGGLFFQGAWAMKLNLKIDLTKLKKKDRRFLPLSPDPSKRKKSVTVESVYKQWVNLLKEDKKKSMYHDWSLLLRMLIVECNEANSDSFIKEIEKYAPEYSKKVTSKVVRRHGSLHKKSFNQILRSKRSMSSTNVPYSSTGKRKVLGAPLLEALKHHKDKPFIIRLVSLLMKYGAYVGDKEIKLALQSKYSKKLALILGKK